MHRTPINDGPAADQVAGDGQVAKIHRDGAVMRTDLQDVAAAKECRGIVSVAELRRALGDGAQDRMYVGRRRGDHLQNCAGRSLLLERFRELAIARLHFIEEPRVLDRDHGLIREGLEQRYLRFGERLDLGASHPDYANGLAFPKQRDREHGPVADPMRHRPTLRKFLGGVREIGDMYGCTLQDGTPTGPFP